MGKVKIPVLRGILKNTDGVTIIKVWCPYCECYHTHGWPYESRSSRKKEHRTAHCGDIPQNNSPFRETGYMIGILPKP